jgi:hypothetical protein
VPRGLLADVKAFEKKLSLLHKSLQLAALQNSFRIFTDQPISCHIQHLENGFPSRLENFHKMNK